jgi:dTDP-4-amino-4,6-dideoxygalactose transaminase
LRFHGSRDKRTFQYVGYNSRLDEVQAAVLRVLLPHLDRWSDGRRAAARAYQAAGLGDYVDLPGVSQGADPVWHLYVVTHPAADELIAALSRQNIQARAYYRAAVHRQPAMAPFAPGDTALPVTEELSRTNLALPMSPVLEQAQAQQVVASVAAWTQARGSA